MSDEKSETKAPTEAGGAVRGVYASVPADRATGVPEAASARLAWTDGERSLEYEARAAKLTKEYEEQFGPMGELSQNTSRWAWVSDPWPWEKEGN